MNRYKKLKNSWEMVPEPGSQTRVVPNLPPLPADRFYAGIKKKRGPRRKTLAERLQKPERHVENPYWSYTVSYKLRILSYWIQTRVPCSLTRVRELTREEVAHYFRVPAANLSWWRKEERDGKFTAMKARQRRAEGGGRERRWMKMEKELFEKFWEWRAVRHTGKDYPFHPFLHTLGLPYLHIVELTPPSGPGVGTARHLQTTAQLRPNTKDHYHWDLSHNTVYVAAVCLTGCCLQDIWEETFGELMQVVRAKSVDVA